METKDACFYCHIAFALAEERVEFEGKDYHPECDKKRKSKTRLREFLIRHAIENGLTITPRHHLGR